MTTALFSPAVWKRTIPSQQVFGKKKNTKQCKSTGVLFAQPATITELHSSTAASQKSAVEQKELTKSLSFSFQQTAVSETIVGVSD